MAKAKKSIYCYETKEKFESIKEASTKYNISKAAIIRVIDIADKVSGGYHWCTDLSIFDNVNLKTGKDDYKKEIWCWEDNKKFSSLAEAAEYYGFVASTVISKVLDKPNRTVYDKHFCTDLSIFNNIKLTKHRENYKKEVYCYETKQKFESIKEAAAFTNTSSLNLGNVINDPNKSAGYYHWCTDLSIFDGVELTKYNDLVKKEVYCYETKEKFESIAEAELYIETSGISNICDNPNRTAGGFHWCTDLSIFDGVELIYSDSGIAKIIYCYETKEKFESISNAAKQMNLVNGSNIILVTNNPNRTCNNYHWCTSLDIFDGVELIYPDSGISAAEKEVVDYIKLIYNKEVIENSRNIISPKELDVYIPDLNLAFEFNGSYWHSEQQGKNRNYHINKTNLCKEKGIQLIHIYEHQWKTNKEVWLSFIANKLKVNPNKVYARKCEVKLVESNISKEFCDKNHLQKSANSNINLGLYHNDELISLMTFGKPRFNKDYEWELIRFCNKGFTNVIGGASKLLKYFEINFKPKSLLSYAEIDYSDGNLYSSLNFNLLKVNDPNYVWIKQDVVLPRYQTMKHKLENLLFNFDSNLTEAENMENNDYNKIWKCGTYVFVKNY